MTDASVPYLVGLIENARNLKTLWWVEYYGQTTIAKEVTLVNAQYGLVIQMTYDLLRNQNTPAFVIAFVHSLDNNQLTAVGESRLREAAEKRNSDTAYDVHITLSNLTMNQHGHSFCVVQWLCIMYYCTTSLCDNNSIITLYCVYAIMHSHMWTCRVTAQSIRYIIRQALGERPLWLTQSIFMLLLIMIWGKCYIISDEYNETINFYKSSVASNRGHNVWAYFLVIPDLSHMLLKCVIYLILVWSKWHYWPCS